MPCLAHTLCLSLHTNSENIAFNFSGKSYTYLELTKRIAYFQKVLFSDSQLIESIGIIANQDFDTYSVILASLLSGITYIPVEPSHPDDRNNQILRISGVKAIYCSEYSNLSPEFYKTNKKLFLETLPETRDSEKMEVKDTQNPAYILFTSGSTGVPKGVPIRMQNLDTFCENVNRMNIGISEKSRFLQVFELTFDLSVFSYLIPLLNGASVFTVPKTSFLQMAAIQLIEEQKITHILTVPSFANHLKPLFAKIKLPSVTNWLFCGEALKSDLVAAWQNCIPEATIYNVYGPTEATIFCTSYLCDKTNVKNHHGITCIGKPFEGTEFELFEADERITGFYTAAELCISGSQLTPGYLHDPEKNKNAFLNHDGKIFYRTGDVCLKDEEGDYFFAGRNDSQVKINGYRVEISELEFHAAKFPDIEECVALVSVTEKSDQQLNMVYTSRHSLDNDTIISYLSTKIPSYMLPANIYFISSIPHNLNGKIDKQALAKHINQTSK